jgi:hypothetical protein
MLKPIPMNNLELHMTQLGIIAYEAPVEMKLNEQVQLKNINVVYERGKVNIQWKAVTRGNDFIFIIERSDDGKLFEIIGINAYGKASEDNEIICNHTDLKPSTKYPYYRIIYVEKSKVIFGQIRKIENYDMLVIDRMNKVNKMSNVA